MNWRSVSSLYLVWAAFYLDCLVYTIIIPVIPSYLKQLKVSQSAIGILFASKGLAQMLSSPIWGWIVDRIGPRKPLFCSTVILCLSTIAFALGNNYWFLLVARSVEGFASGAAFSAGMAYLSLVFESEEERNGVMGWAQTGVAAGLISGAPFGGILYGVSGRKELPFFVVAGLVGVFGLSQLCITDFAPRAENVKAKTKEGEDAQKEPYEGIFRLARDPQVWLVAVMFLLAATMLSSLDPIFPIWFEEKFHKNATVTGLVFMVATLAYAIGNPIVAYVGPKIGRPAMMSLGALFLGAVLPASALCPKMWQTIICMFLFGFSVSFIDSSAFPYLSMLVEMRHSAKYFGAIYSISDIASSLGAVIGPIVGSLLYDKFNYFIALYCFGAISMLYAPLVVIFAARPRPPVALIDISIN